MVKIINTTPMDFSFTTLEDSFEEYSLAILKLIEKLPDTFFNKKELSPSSKIIDNIISYSKKLNQ